MSTKIEWATDTWNPIIGCTKASPGCAHCYAERMAGRIANMDNEDYQQVVEGDVIRQIRLGKWNGKTHFVESAITKPLSWKKPRRIFMCSMGDMFHESVPFEWIDKVMAIAALTPIHTYLLLTKRPERMKEYFAAGKDALVERWEKACYDLGIADKNEDVDTPACFIYNRANGHTENETTGWPMTNVWLGVTAENQEWADKRIPVLLQIPAAIHFVSVEPMLGPVDLTRVKKLVFTGLKFIHALKGIEWFADVDDSSSDTHSYKLDWVICGGESGPGARPMHPEWVLSLRDQCQAADTPFMFKQWGEYALGSHPKTSGKNHFLVLNNGDFGPYHGIELTKKYSLSWQNMNATVIRKVGKKAAGRELNGEVYDQYPI